MTKETVDAAITDGLTAAEINRCPECGAIERFGLILHVSGCGTGWPDWEEGVRPAGAGGDVVALEPLLFTDYRSWRDYCQGRPDFAGPHELGEPPGEYYLHVGGGIAAIWLNDHRRGEVFSVQRVDRRALNEEEVVSNIPVHTLPAWRPSIWKRALRALADTLARWSR